MTDRQTDRQTEFSSLERVYIPCSAVKLGKETSDNQIYVTLSKTVSGVVKI